MTMFDLSQPSAPIHGRSDRFPVRRIYCVGQNYAAHAREMGGDPDRAPPFFFTKFADAIAANDARLPYPPQTQDYHYEAELVLAIGAPARDIAPERALDVVFGYACGLDMTRRDLQAEAKKAGRPWDMAKNFTASAPLGALHPIAETGALTRGRLRLTVNGETRQEADLSDMIWAPHEIIAHLSRFDALAPGDLIFTGTPAGVGPVKRGDALVVTIEGLSDLRATIA
ncbi:MAG: fumarylacetoacetate hydrolase family protein [Hyphomonadaceae bacterium]|nr:fumarylacetoacetate hydrolase family protein [Hyphomonadaceae bacterium]